MESRLSFEDPRDSLDRRLIQELVELRQCRVEKEQLLASHRALVSTLSDMEVRMTELEAQLGARDFEIRRLKEKLQKATDSDRETAQSDTSSIANRKADSELDHARLPTHSDEELEVRYAQLLKQVELISAERDFFRNQALHNLSEESTPRANVPIHSKRTHTMSLAGKANAAHSLLCKQRSLCAANFMRVKGKRQR